MGALGHQAPVRRHHVTFHNMAVATLTLVDNVVFAAFFVCNSWSVVDHLMMSRNIVFVKNMFEIMFLKWYDLEYN